MGTITVRRLAWDVLLMAHEGGMPDTYWHTDSRIARACRILNYTPDQAREWAARHGNRGNRVTQ